MKRRWFRIVLVVLLSQLFHVVAHAEERATPIADAVRAFTLDDVEPAQTRRERIESGLIMTSFGSSMVALGITTACTGSGECRERNPLMRRWLGQGTTRAVLVKSAASAGVHYALWRAPKSRWRTVAIVAVAAINVADAVNDVVVMRRIERGRH